MHKDELIICRCEEVSYSKLVATAAKYSCSARELKLRTRAGMGYCGGRTCRPMVDKIALASGENHLYRKDLSLKVQPPIRPVSFVNLGGDQK